MFLSWGGISGGQFTLLGMLELALEHQIPFDTIAEWTAAAPAKRFGLQKKGGLRRGVMQISCSSAWSRTLLQENRCLQSIKSIYEGHTFPCGITATYSKGRCVYNDGEKVIEIDGALVVPS